VNLRQFIETHLETVDHLRCLLHLKGTPRTEWDVTDLSLKLYLSPAVAATVLSQLEAKGLVVITGEPPRYRFQPRTAELSGLIEELAEMDRTHPVTLINLVYARRTHTEAFADAFKLRKGQGN
jgi:hypothetical protein